ncbi:hypothetical protein [Amycolatopsis samaneae]|uniref:XRE family transcriptional regulator n=1 Tax=Amycolatopsis samaneae TaxID=664691 RepID=A0ABW5GGX9_9PSEU
MVTGAGVSIQEALTFLYAKRKREDGKPYSDRDVSEALAGYAVEASHSYLWQLRNGRKDNPRANVLYGLGKFFGVPAGFFLDLEVYERWRMRISAGADADIPAPRGQHAMLLRGDRRVSDRFQALLDQLTDHVSELENDDGTADTYG